MKKYLGIAFILLMVFAVAVGLVLVKRQQYVGSKASVQSGIATLRWGTEGVSLNAGAVVDMPLRLVSALSTQVDGIEVAVQFSGNLPTDMVFTPASNSQLVLVHQQMVPNADGKKLRFAFLSTGASTPLAMMGNTPIVLGSLHFTVPSAGALKLAFDPAFSRVSQHTTAKDILASPNTLTLSYTSSTVATSTPAPCTSPAIPTMFKAVAKSKSSAQLKWNQSQGASDYSVLYGKNPNNYTQVVVHTGNVNSYLINGLSARSTYYFALAATNACGNSARAKTSVWIPKK